jgi:DNA-binding XRE family transcriptional regulator
LYSTNSLDKVDTVYYNIIDMPTWTPDKIRELRKLMELTQWAFAERIGVTRQYVNFLEKGVRRPSKTLCILMDWIAEKENKRGKESGEHGKRNLQKR